MKLYIFAVIAALFLGAVMLSQTPAPQLPPLPVRDSPTIPDLKEQIADCAISANAQSKYEAKLIARIRELEQLVVALKAPPTAPKLPDTKPK